MSAPDDLVIEMLIEERNTLREQVATLTAEVASLEDANSYWQRTNATLTAERDRLLDDLNRALTLKEIARADVERLTKERDDRESHLGHVLYNNEERDARQAKLDEVVAEKSRVFTEAIEAARADNARHLAAIETLRAEKSTMEDALFNLVNDIPDAIGEAYNRGISDGHPICNMPTGVKDITKALLEHADYAKKADEVEG